MQQTNNIRLFVNQSLFVGVELVLDKQQSHYLSNVMRKTTGDVVCCFNEKDGEFLASIELADKNKTRLRLVELLNLPKKNEDLWLLFAPLKKDKTDFVIEKAVELGVSKIVPVITSRCIANPKQIKTERYIAQAIEAAEQCRRLSVPEISSPITLPSLLTKWNNERILYFMDEHRMGNDAATVFAKSPHAACAILIGPEGGFSDEENRLLSSCSFVRNVSLGPRILRAETAVAAALSVWQAVAGDWQIEKD